jgi:putative hydrolase of the HAD superfamily
MHGTPQPAALLIDGLGTLVSLAPPAPALVDELAVRFAISVSEADARAALRAEIGFYRAHMGLGRDADGLAALRRRCAEVLRDALPRPERLGRVPIDDLTAALLAALRFDAFPDARDALIAARRAGARVIVVSNWDVGLLEVLERVGLAALLDAAVTSAAIGVRKPAPEIFHHALALAHVPAARAIHVGDSLDEDVVGARAAGIAPVLLRRGAEADGDPAPAGCPTISGLGELTWP